MNVLAISSAGMRNISDNLFPKEAAKLSDPSISSSDMSKSIVKMMEYTILYNALGNLIKAESDTTNSLIDDKA